MNSTEGKQLQQFSAEDCISLQLEASHLQPQPSSPKMEVVRAILYLNDLQTSSQLVYHCLLGSQMPEMKTIGLVSNLSSNNLKKPDPSYKPQVIPPFCLASTLFLTFCPSSTKLNYCFCLERYTWVLKTADTHIQWLLVYSPQRISRFQTVTQIALLIKLLHEF